MALQTNNYTVNATATLIASDSPSGVRVRVHNTDQGNPVYVGSSSSVSTVTGFRVDAKQAFDVLLNPSEQLWAICATAQSAVVSIIRQTQYA